MTAALLKELIGKAVFIAEIDVDRRHTTTHRELFRLPGGALLIDTPGMRELGLMADDAALDESSADITALMAICKFSNCTHGGAGLRNIGVAGR